MSLDLGTLMLVVAAMLTGYLVFKALRHERRRIAPGNTPEPPREGHYDWDSKVKAIGRTKYMKLLFQIACVLVVVVGAPYLCSSVETDLHALDSGAVASVRINSLLALAYEVMGAAGALMVLRIACFIAFFGTLHGVWEEVQRLRKSSAEPRANEGA